MYREGQENFEIKASETEAVLQNSSEIEKLIQGLLTEEENDEKGIKPNSGAISRRGFLKAAAVAVGAVALSVAAGKIAAAAERSGTSEKEKEPLTERQKINKNLEELFGQRIVSTSVESVDAGKDGVIVFFDLKDKGEGMKDVPPFASMIIPEKKLSKCNDKLAEAKKEIDAICERLRVAIKEQLKTKKQEDLAKDEKFKRFIFASEARIKKITHDAINYLDGAGDRLNGRTVTLEGLKSKFKEKINSSLLKLKDGGYGYKKTLKDGTMEYRELFLSEK